VSLQPSAPHKGRRWLALFGIVILVTGVFAGSALAAFPTGFPTSYSWTLDDAGVNDVPGQKDLTGQATATVNSHFFTTWAWDDTAWTGKNTGDACSLFDTNSTKRVDYAVCVTVATRQATEQSTRVYSCTDRSSDRCTGSALIGTETDPQVWCDVQPLNPGLFDGILGYSDSGDTQAACDITTIATDVPVSSLGSGTLLNSCSYPSQQPNSDPSDCVLTPINADTGTTTQSSGTTTWSATLNDIATLSPSTATGTVIFKLWTTSLCNDLAPVWESAPVTVSSGAATTVGAGTTSGTHTITQATVDADGIYYWTTDYTPTGLFNGSSSSCGEATTITPASVAGAAG
jgi:hypothetical protein